VVAHCNGRTGNEGVTNTAGKNNVESGSGNRCVRNTAGDEVLKTEIGIRMLGIQQGMKC
jgi:hypothetical protein